MLRTSLRLLWTAAVVAASLNGPAGASAATPSPVPPGLGMALLQGPAADRADPRAHEYIVDNVAPGASISRQIAVSNGDAVAARVLLYPDAASIQNGSFSALAGEAANELTTWMTMSPSSATIPAGQTIPVTVTITVPADASAGERYAAALAELPPAQSASGGIQLISRVGIRVYLSVSNGGPAPSSFSIDSLTAGRDRLGNPRVCAQVHNTGGRALDLSGELSLAGGPAGLSAGPFPATLGTTLAIGDHESVTVPLDRQLPAGPRQAHITLTSGLISEQAEAILTFPVAAAGSTAPATATPLRRRSFPTLPATGTLALLATLGTLRVLQVRRRRRPLPRHPRHKAGAPPARSLSGS